MKKLFAICALFAALIFIVSCGDGKKNDDKTDTGGSAADEDDAEAEPSDADPANAGPTDAEPADDTDPDSAATDNDTTENGSDADTGAPEKVVTCKESDGIHGELTTCAGDTCETVECPDGNSCNRLLTGCGECQNGTKSDCRESDSGMVIYQCYAGSFSVFKECPNGCNSAGNDCAGDECTDGDTKCVNGSDEKGETYNCMNGRWQKDEEQCLGSCDETMKQCGEDNCVNYTMKCRDDMLTASTGGGAIAQCKFGKWEIYEECSAGASCKNENSCGECRNGDTKCEDHDVDAVMNKNCNAKGECETDSNGNTKWYPANIGVQLLCSNGKWSDDMYCPAVAGTFQQFRSGYVKWTTEMTWLYHIYESTLVHDDYHYSSCHNDSKNGISECGKCHNTFYICSDENISGKPQGHIYRCENGEVVSKQMCGMKTCNLSTLTSCNN